MSTAFLNYNQPLTLDKTFVAINKMVLDGVIETYALGGAMANMFYMEPESTFDVDIFCVIPGDDGTALQVLRPIYEYLENKGCVPQDETILIEGFRVQFLPVFDPLNEEAVRKANVIPYLGVPVRVMTPEHLVAIMLQTGRPKDDARVARFVSAEAFDRKRLTRILSRHRLAGKLAVLKRLERGLIK